MVKHTVIMESHILPCRYLFNPGRSMCHPQKSRMLKYAVAGGQAHVYTLSDNISSTNELTDASQDAFDTRITEYFFLQLDFMNAIHYRGNDCGKDSIVIEIVTGKMKRILQRWNTGERARYLHEIHLHIDDPKFVINRKRIEQARRDMSRLPSYSAQTTSASNAFDTTLEWCAAAPRRNNSDSTRLRRRTCYNTGSSSERSFI